MKEKIVSKPEKENKIQELAKIINTKFHFFRIITDRPRKAAMQLILVGILIVLFNGCKTPQQLMDKAERKNPAIVAEYARDKYPCTELLKPDTAVIFKDTTIYVDCPDTAQTSPYEVTVTDTVNRIVTKTIRVPVTIRLPGTTITKWYEDSAKLKLAELQIQGLQKDTTRLQAQVDEYQGKAHRRGLENLIWRLIALSLIAFKIIKWYIKPKI